MSDGTDPFAAFLRHRHAIGGPGPVSRDNPRPANEKKTLTWTVTLSPLWSVFDLRAAFDYLALGKRHTRLEWDRGKVTAELDQQQYDNWRVWLRRHRARTANLKIRVVKGEADAEGIGA